MDFYIDIGFAVLLRILKDRRASGKYLLAFKKLYDAIGRTFNAEKHITFDVPSNRIPS